MIITATCKQKATQMWMYCDNRILNLNCSRAWWKSNTNEIAGYRQTLKTLRWVNDIHHQWWNTRIIPSEMKDIYWEKYRHRPAWNQVNMDMFWRAKEQQSYVCNLLSAYTRYWMQKATFKKGYLRWRVVCSVDWIRFVRLQKMVRQTLDCGWSKNYRTQLQNPNFEPAPKGLFLITGLELDLCPGVCLHDTSPARGV